MYNTWEYIDESLTIEMFIPIGEIPIPMPWQKYADEEEEETDEIE